MNPQEFYNKKKKYSQGRLYELKRKLAINSGLRLLFFILIFVILYSFLRSSFPIAITGAILSLMLFLFLVRRNIKLQKKREYYQAYFNLVCNEIDALSYDFRNFNNGEKFINHRHYYSYDLDLFGKGSAFAMLNRSVTVAGENQLAEILLKDETDKDEILAAQEATKELTGMEEFLLHFRATGATSDIIGEEREKIGEWCRTTSYIKGKRWLKILAYLLPAVTIIALIFAIINTDTAPVFIIFFLLNFAVVGWGARKTGQEHNKVSGFLKILTRYQALLEVVCRENFSSGQLNRQSEKLNLNNQSAEKALKQLTQLVSAFDSRLNLFVAVFLEGILLYDYHCLFAIEKWRETFGEHLTEWLDVVAFLDAKISLATFAYKYPANSYPTVVDEVTIKATELGHPLIPPSVRVCNDFEISKKNEFVIITGANMAGKSTFLRTVGINLTFAKVGLPVCAETFEFMPLKLFTSMRTSDSLAENESYFYAELRRLKEIIMKLEKGEALFIILDEILKGTNSVDKQNGSFKALEKIIHLNGTGIIATHDLALTSIADKFPDKIKNQCFEIEIDNAKISFDYKLYDGVTKKMNAMLLMEQMGII